MKWIQSSENPLIKEIKKIIKQPEERVFIEGINLIETAINSTNVQLEKILVTDSFIERHSEFFKTLQDKFSVIGISQKIAKEISDTVTPQGIFAMAKFKFSNINEIKNPTLIVIADRIQDPGNLGTIIRASEALGAEAILLTSGTCNPLSGKVLRASAGSIFFIPLIEVSYEEINEFISKNKITLVVTELKAKQPCFNLDLTLPVAVAFGNESHGVSEELKKIKHISCRIPHRGKTESLNVAMSAAVLLYEILRQRSL
ncbi:RNA methyltransferase, TrmH family [Thermodesulfovibrio aggregans]|uniref:RNA methyltransferase, TrmH family n=1 Tax=Thermodesulfovibrio aggregans TaxID=86166 RepID=A0A0U9HXE8_9BACT|nr:RNA methyltransferase [Thermodesulfovibrio aggregans]GAQ95279.1 RNA methyltransferase, TrmH family [Thermodesulfovibrio aggregans]